MCCSNAFNYNKYLLTSRGQPFLTTIARAGVYLIYFHVSHEQFPPSLLLRLVKQAEAAGFEGALSSDHFKPWSENQAQSGFAWSWLGAAMQATTIPFGIVTVASYRYHPAIIAQASAT